MKNLSLILTLFLALCSARASVAKNIEVDDLFLAEGFAEDYVRSAYPRSPDLAMTPGSTCDLPIEKRYPEKIDYCGRDVDTDTKRAIIASYDQELGYHIGQMARARFKIDHLIPLCAGGSNDVDNLWPQHESVYTITDPLEQEVCIKMAQGRLKQAAAIQFILAAKMDLKAAPGILKRVRSL